jgi:hypothetical protein
MSFGGNLSPYNYVIAICPFVSGLFLLCLGEILSARRTHGLIPVHCIRVSCYLIRCQ